MSDSDSAIPVAPPVATPSVPAVEVMDPPAETKAPTPPVSALGGLGDLIKGFNSSNLAKTSTVVRRIDGTCFIEEKGQALKKEDGPRFFGFVPDYSKDDELHGIKLLVGNPSETGVYISSWDGAANLQALEGNWITHILNCTPNQTVHEKRFTCLQLPLLDIEKEDVTKHFQTATDWMRGAVTGGGRVLVHCHAGISRSATFVVAYMIRFHYLCVTHAIKTVKKCRDKIEPNEGFIKQLRNFQRKLDEEAGCLRCDLCGRV